MRLKVPTLAVVSPYSPIKPLLNFANNRHVPIIPVGSVRCMWFKMVKWAGVENAPVFVLLTNRLPQGGTLAITAWTAVYRLTTP